MKETLYIDGTVGEVSDGYHTFNELYEHRNMLFIKLCRALNRAFYVWKSKTHSDGTTIPGWFILGLNKEPGEQITYHLPLYLWDEAGFAEPLLQAPPFDGHTSENVLDRLANLNFM